jgi:hypothetical protein
MPRPPELIKGIVFDEPFFDAVIRQAGGHRLDELYIPPPDTKHVDYLVSGYALELKTLVIDPLESPERQAKLQQFLSSEFPRGPLYVTATRREATLTGPIAKKFWSWYIGSSIKDALDRASDQINEVDPIGWTGDRRE